jgi:hypothetical protein
MEKIPARYHSSAVSDTEKALIPKNQETNDER